MAKPVLISVGLFYGARKRGRLTNRAAARGPWTPQVRSPANGFAPLRMTARGVLAGGRGLPACARSFILLIRFQRDFRSSGAAIFHAQAHIPAQPSSPLEDARISDADEDQGRPRGDLAPARQGPQAGVGEARLP